MTEDKELTHIDASGNPTMVDVSDKVETKRTATAQTIVRLPSQVLQHFEGNDIKTKKGPVFHTSIIAGVMGAKKTHELIPFCHPLMLNNCKVNLTREGSEVVITCVVATTGKTGVEMEALTGASIAALTLYDMCKALSHDIIISETKLIQKSGGKKDFKREEA